MSVSCLSPLPLLSLLLLVCLVCQSSGEQKIVDLTRPFNNKSVSFAGSTSFSLESVQKGPYNDFWLEMNNFCWGDHAGTYMNAPARFAEGKWLISQIPLDHLIAPGVMITKATETADVYLNVEDLEAWEEKNGKMEKGAIVLVNFDWGKYHDTDREKYLGTAAAKPEKADTRFPGISPDAAKWLVDRSVHGVGVDTPMVDKAPSQDFPTHHIFSEANIYTLGNLDKMNKLKTKGFTIYALPPKITEGSGTPVRAMVVE